MALHTRTDFLRADSNISAKLARELVFYFIRSGEHDQNGLRRLPDADVEASLRARGYPLDRLVSNLQANPHLVVLEFENLASMGTFSVSASPGIKITTGFISSGKEFGQREITDQGNVRISYIADFAAACSERDRAIAQSSIDHFYSALAKGFSSLEAYFDFKMEIHNTRCLPQERLSNKDEKGQWIDFDTKIREWLPRLTGTCLDLGRSPAWSDYKVLQQMRHDAVIHPKLNAGVSSLRELAEGINLFRSGIASLMFMLYKCFDEPMPREVIRAMLYPTVRVVSN